ncbi:MAG TPA: hypothetical protein VGN34_00745 [Ktedonobacteraceae bacterium]
MLAPVPVAPVNETDMVLLPEGLKALKEVAKEVGLDLRGAYLNLDGGFGHWFSLMGTFLPFEIITYAI